MTAILNPTSIAVDLTGPLARYDIIIDTIAELDDPGDCLRCDTEGAETEAQVYYTHAETGNRMNAEGCLTCVAKVIQRFADVDFPVTVEVTA